jgi:hypothetical protein
MHTSLEDMHIFGTYAYFWNICIFLEHMHIFGTYAYFRNILHIPGEMFQKYARILDPERNRIGAVFPVFP